MNVGPSDADRYGWPGVPEETLATDVARVARQVFRSGSSVVALLPVASREPLEDRIAPLLLRLGETLRGFVEGDVAIVDTWRTWPWGEAMEWGEVPTHRSRWVRPRVLEVAPVPCGDAAAASVALENALAARPDGLTTTLVNLGGYAAPGAAPAALRLVDGVVLIVRARHTLRRAVAKTVHHIPDGKLLGAILVG